MFTKQTHLHCVNDVFIIMGHNNISNMFIDSLDLADELLSTQNETLVKQNKRLDLWECGVWNPLGIPIGHE